MMDEIRIKNLIEQVSQSTDSGFLLIDKPSGEPSMRTVSQLRRITGQKSIGFAGTLDPAASGLLILGINKATKLLDAWHQWPKEYEAEITLGKVSTTYDSEGVITTPPFRPSPPWKGGERGGSVSQQEIKETLQRFVGTIEQIPPMHSAKSIDGKRLYELARAGKEIERKPSVVTIHTIDIIDYHYPILKIRVSCSTGTYIRSLAHDVGETLGAGAYLSALRRTAIGPYTVNQSEVCEAITASNWQEKFIDIQRWLEALNINI